MRKLSLAFVTALLLTGCGNAAQPEYPTDLPPPAYDEPMSSSSFSSEQEEEMQRMVLVDQSFESAASVTGAARLKAMHTMILQNPEGDLRDAKIHFELSRNGQNEGVSGVHMYMAQLDAKGNIIPDTEWTKFRAVGASWLDGKCQLAGSSELLSGKDEKVTVSYGLDDLRVSMPKPECMKGIESLNLYDNLSSGIALGFLPTNTGYHLKVTLEYRGHLEAKYW